MCSPAEVHFSKEGLPARVRVADGQSQWIKVREVLRGFDVRIHTRPPKQQIIYDLLLENGGLASITYRPESDSWEIRDQGPAPCPRGTRHRKPN